MLEINQEQLQESFNRHIKDIADWSVTNVQMELSTRPAMFHNENPIFYMPEKRTFTYDGYTQSGKRFSLVIDD